MSGRPAYIHHVNFPTTDPDRTIEWYTKVFGMKYIKPKSNTKVVLMTRGNFDLHFTPVEEMDRMAPYHFAVEVEDWDGFLAHLREQSDEDSGHSDVVFHDQDSAYRVSHDGHYGVRFRSRQAPPLASICVYDASLR